MKTRTKIAMLVFSTYPSDVRVRREAETLQQNGMQVDVICYRKKDQLDREVINGVNVCRLNINRTRSKKSRYIYEYLSFITASFFKLNQLYRKSKYQIVHVHNMPEILVFSALLPRLFGSKIILDLHDPTPEVYMTKYKIPAEHFIIKLLIFLERASIKFAHLVITPNIAFRDKFVERGCPTDKIKIVMNTPKDESFQLFASDSMAGSKSTPDTFTIMYHGTIVERHGLEIALNALVLLRDKIPNIIFNVYGDGEYTTQFLKTVMNLKLDKMVKYHGFVKNEEIAKAITSIDIGIIPNLKSPFTDLNLPVRIFEYLCFKKPVIVPKTVGILDYFDENSINFFNAGDATSLAATIHNIYKEPDVQNKVIDNGFQIYQKYRWLYQGEKFVNHVRKLINPNSLKMKISSKKDFRLHIAAQLANKNK